MIMKSITKMRTNVNVRAIMGEGECEEAECKAWKAGAGRLCIVDTPGREGIG